MARVLEKLLHVHLGVAESGPGLGLGGLHRVQQRRLGVHDPHAATATTASRLDDDGITHRLGGALDDDRIVGQSAVRARHARHAGADHGLLGRNLVAHQANRLGRRADEGEPALLDPLGEIGVLRQEAVAGVNGFGVGHLGRGDDGGHAEVALPRSRRPDTDRLIRQAHILGIAIGFGIDHHRLDAHLTASALDPQGNFTPVGDQDFFEHGPAAYSMTNRGWPYSTA
ncbi:hypothetical protein FQZ97_785360 [compost metagenome]